MNSLWVMFLITILYCAYVFIRHKNRPNYGISKKAVSQIKLVLSLIVPIIVIKLVLLCLVAFKGFDYHKNFIRILYIEGILFILILEVLGYLVENGWGNWLLKKQK
ncbi:MAG: hypothetical protein KJO26_03720 [Deltaproteobacteria bacterium]|nr:hypothetical protein [Deltaproteobacteria bacterium]